MCMPWRDKVYSYASENDLQNISKSLYKIFSKDEILKNFYSEDNLVDLRTVCFPVLNSVNPDSLNEISHIQACQTKTKMFVEILLY